MKVLSALLLCGFFFVCYGAPEPRGSSSLISQGTYIGDGTGLGNVDICMDFGFRGLFDKDGNVSTEVATRTRQEGNIIYRTDHDLKDDGVTRDCKQKVYTCDTSIPNSTFVFNSTGPCK